MGTMEPLILVCDDEPDLVDLLALHLGREGFRALAVGNGQAVLDATSAGPLPEAILLDLMLPDISGIEVCRRIRRDPRTAGIPIVVLSARGEEIDRVVAFEVGADDYVVKPFSVRELLLRLRAILRRTTLPAAEGPDPVTRDRLRVERDAHRASVDGRGIELSLIEFQMLCAFVERPGRVLSRETLLEAVWGRGHHITVRTIDTHVKRLRAKLGTARSAIETVRRIGYRYTPLLTSVGSPSSEDG
jgi:two-component system phosphate regulon response regulator PhoB